MRTNYPSNQHPSIFLGWSEAHDEHLLIVVDKFGLEDIHGKLKHLPKLFDAIQPLDEHLLLRRVVEICATLEQGKWTGAASIENLEETTATASGEQGTSGGQQSTSVIVGKGAKGGGGGGNGGNGRKKVRKGWAKLFIRPNRK